MTQDLNICLLPLEISWGDKYANMAQVEDMLSKVHPMTDLVILPETFSTGFPSGMDKEDVRVMAERNTGVTIDRIKELAAKYQMGIAGSFIADSGGSLYNRAFFIEPSGDEQFEDKHHLFTMAGEEKVFSRGYDRMLFRFRGWNIAIVICYDIRFPVWCRNVMNEYDALICVANWPKVRIDALNKLLPARAIENQSYVCCVNCKGTDNKDFEYGGEAAIYDFKGRDISVTAGDSGLVYAALSRERLDGFRAKFRAWQDADTFKLI